MPLLTLLIIKLVKYAQEQLKYAQRKKEIEDAMKTILSSGLDFDFMDLMLCDDERLLEISKLIKEGKL